MFKSWCEWGIRFILFGLFIKDDGTAYRIFFVFVFSLREAWGGGGGGCLFEGGRLQIFLASRGR